VVADPNLALVLMALGIAGIYIELCWPGKILPGVAGGVLFLVGFASLWNTPSGAPIWWPLAAPLAALWASVTAWLLRVAWRARRNKRLR
jgi:hypothetical protein